jgi:PKD repeat protein/photosystem II stability/assembly factor-like uncharacterized protein
MHPIYRDADSTTSVKSMHFIHDGEGYVVFDKWFGHAIDSGRTIQRLDITSANLNFGSYQVDFSKGFSVNGFNSINENRVFVYGQMAGIPSILLTLDKGETFTLLYHNLNMEMPLGEGITNMIFPGNGDRGIAINAGEILLSTDRGASWQPVFSDYSNDFRGIDRINETTILVYSNSRILKTTDGGTTWSDVYIPGAALVSIDFITSAKGWAINGPYLLRTVDGGLNWEEMNPEQSYDPFGAIYFRSDSVGFMNGSAFTTLMTTDGGYSWEPLHRFDPFQSGTRGHRIMTIVRSSNSLFVGGAHGNIERLRTNDANPLPKAVFLVDSSDYANSQRLLLHNYSSKKRRFNWLHQGKLIAETYDASIVTDRSKADTIQLIAIAGTDRDTMTIVLPARMVDQSCDAEFNFQIDSTELQVTAISQNPGEQHFWNMGDGQLRNGLAAFRYSYQATGTYIVEHILYNDVTGCADTIFHEIKIQRLANCLKGEIEVKKDGLAVNERKFQFHLDTLIEKNPATLLTWNFGDGQTSTQNSPTHLFVKPGSYEICLNLLNRATNCISQFCTNLEIEPNPDSCSAKFNSYTKGSDPAVQVADRIVYLETEDQPNKERILHTWSINGRDTLNTGNEGHFSAYFFQDSQLAGFSGKTGDECSSDLIAAIHVDSLNRSVQHFVYDPATGCRDSFTLVVRVPTRKNISFITLPDDQLPGGLRIHALDNRDSMGIPHYSVWNITSGENNYFTGDYTEGNQTLNHAFDATGTYRMAVAENTCENGRREVYYTNYTVSSVGCPTYDPQIFYTQSNLSDPLLISFRDSSDRFSQYQTNKMTWYFGDGDSSFNARPEHKYNQPGIYTVGLKYTTASGCIKTGTVQLKLELPCTVTADLEVSKNPANPSSYSFSSPANTSTNQWKYTWYFGDGDTADTRSVTHTYKTAGSFHVQLKVQLSDLTCSVMKDTILLVEPAELCQLKASYTTVIDGNSVLFKIDTASSLTGTTFHWSFGDGNESTNVVPLHRFDTSGSYLVCLTIKKDDNCAIQYCDSVRISYSELRMIQAYPNPVQGQMMVQYFSEKNEAVVFDLISESGMVLLSKRQSVLSGSNNIPFDLAGFKNGIYIIRTTSVSGVRQFFRVVKL